MKEGVWIGKSMNGPLTLICGPWTAYLPGGVKFAYTKRGIERKARKALRRRKESYYYEVEV